MTNDNLRCWPLEEYTTDQKTTELLTHLAALDALLSATHGREARQGLEDLAKEDLEVLSAEIPDADILFSR